MNDFITILKLLLERTMNGQTQDKAFRTICFLIFLWIALLGSAAIITAISQLLTALPK